MSKLNRLMSVAVTSLATQVQAHSIDGAGAEETAAKRQVLPNERKLEMREEPALGDGKRPPSKKANAIVGKRKANASVAAPTRIENAPLQGGVHPNRDLAQQIPDDATAGINNGHDITRPEHRVDFFFNTNQGSDGSRSWTTTLRYERPFALEGDWKLAFRVETPFVLTNDPATQALSSGYGDTLFQAILSRTIDDRQGFGVGLRLIAPTATGDQFGNGRWRMLPTAGYRYSLPEISPDTYLQLVARYAFDFAGDNNRRHTSELQLAPSFNVGLPDKWYVTFFPSTDVRYNFIYREWFVPFNLEIGKQWNKSFLTALEIGVPFFDTVHPVYKYKIEAHIGFRF